MTNSLSQMRCAFGWSQDAMAATLGVSVRTIARWETVEPPDTNPFIKFFWLSASRYSNRLYRYAHALLPADYVDAIRQSPFERSVYIGPEAVVLGMSDVTRQTWGMFRHAEGMSVVAFSAEGMRSLMADNFNKMEEICAVGDVTRTVNFVTSDAPRGSTPPLWRKHTAHAPFPGVFDMRSVPISEAEFLATSPKFWVADALGQSEASEALALAAAKSRAAIRSAAVLHQSPE